MALWDPFYDVRGIQRQVDGIFNDFFGESQKRLAQKNWLPAVDVKEKEDGALLIHAELPGIKKEDVHLDVSEGILTLSGEKKDEKKEENEKYHRVERSYGKFTRSFALPKGVDPSTITAAYQDGVLELTIPRPAIKEPERKKIE